MTVLNPLPAKPERMIDQAQPNSRPEPPLIISAADLREFRYHADGHIYDGAFYQGRLYKLVAEFDQQNRVKAIEYAEELTQAGQAAIVAAARHGIRKVWVPIQADIKPTPIVWLPAAD